MLTGSLPFEDIELNGLIHSIVKMKPSFPSSLSPDATDLLKKILKKNQNKRYTILQIKNHKWLHETSKVVDEAYKNTNSGTDIIDVGIVHQMMKINPNLFRSFETIVDDIVKNKINDNTISYKILLRKKENEIFNIQLKLLKKKMPRRSSDASEDLPFHYIHRTRSFTIDKKVDLKKGNKPKKVLISSKGNISKFNFSIKNLK